MRSKATSVLITGESGTGKELVARAIHYRSDRAQAPLMEVNCSSFQEALLENELFGHEKGAYTDATDLKKGLVELCDGGTLFLDEVADMPLPTQAKLLRFIDHRNFKRVGGAQDIAVDIRIVAATNKNPRESAGAVPQRPLLPPQGREHHALAARPSGDGDPVTPLHEGSAEVQGYYEMAPDAVGGWRPTRGPAMCASCAA